MLAALCGTIACADAGSPRRAGQTSVAIATGLPCALESVLKANCQPCHSHPPKHNAPIELVTWDDTQADFMGEPTYQVMGEAVDAGFMPLDPYTLAEGDKQTILDWVAAGAPSNPKPCHD